MHSGTTTNDSSIDRLLPCCGITVQVATSAINRRCFAHQSCDSKASIAINEQPDNRPNRSTHSSDSFVQKCFDPPQPAMSCPMRGLPGGPDMDATTTHLDDSEAQIMQFDDTNAPGDASIVSKSSKRRSHRHSSHLAKAHPCPAFSSFAHPINSVLSSATSIHAHSYAISSSLRTTKPRLHLHNDTSSTSSSKSTNSDSLRFSHSNRLNRQTGVQHGSFTLTHQFKLPPLEFKPQQQSLASIQSAPLAAQLNSDLAAPNAVAVTPAAASLLPNGGIQQQVITSLQCSTDSQQPAARLSASIKEFFGIAGWSVVFSAEHSAFAATSSPAPTVVDPVSSDSDTSEIIPEPQPQCPMSKRSNGANNNSNSAKSGDLLSKVQLAHNFVSPLLAVHQSLSVHPSLDSGKHKLSHHTSLSVSQQGLSLGASFTGTYHAPGQPAALAADSLHIASAPHSPAVLSGSPALSATHSPLIGGAAPLGPMHSPPSGSFDVSDYALGCQYIDSSRQSVTSAVTRRQCDYAIISQRLQLNDQVTLAAQSELNVADLSKSHTIESMKIGALWKVNDSLQLKSCLHRSQPSKQATCPMASSSAATAPPAAVTQLHLSLSHSMPLPKLKFEFSTRIDLNKYPSLSQLPFGLGFTFGEY